MAQRTCSMPDCERRHSARGLCQMHWKREYLRYPVECIWCGVTFRSARREGKFCSDDCKSRRYSEVAATERRRLATEAMRAAWLAADLLKAELASKAALERTRARHDAKWRTARECPGCGCWFSPLRTPVMLSCSKRCARRVERRKRRAAEVGALGSWRWSDFMRIARKFNYCCAYCGVKPDRLDPDHVVPLSRGGYNSPANLLPACLACNSSKCAMTLDEWAAWRADRGLDSRNTNWAPEDRRYTHLTQVLLPMVS